MKNIFTIFIIVALALVSCSQERTTSLEKSKSKKHTQTSMNKNSHASTTDSKNPNSKTNSTNHTAVAKSNIPVENSNNINLNKLTITFPSNWSKRGNENELFFDDENKKPVGGITLVGYYGDYNSTLPNHSEILNTEDIDVSLGKGKLFTLKRSNPADSNNNETWNEIHAVVPANKNNLAYDIWIKGKKNILLNILKSIH
ncbi:hypothetical protein [Neobacillus sp. PS3-40]|uniref:hypothetical protein n=1 Tax=Neobacillus sp. PS3-40 TaxID=3070679 RepID=UPI0027DF2056|nr:hypothetical protein [Neobacillus sp. PS3-40]WML43856.1 hypothetical protein RCG20_19040 [Neobacillus sp. PS3-40]